MTAFAQHLMEREHFEYKASIVIKEFAAAGILARTSTPWEFTRFDTVANQPEMIGIHLVAWMSDHEETDVIVVPKSLFDETHMLPMMNQISDLIIKAKADNAEQQRQEQERFASMTKEQELAELRKLVAKHPEASAIIAQMQS